MSERPPEPDHGEIQDLLGVYALDAVDRDTAAMIERHLETCMRCSAEVAQHHEVAGLLANSGEASPSKLWDGISSQLDGSTPPSWERLSARLETGSDRSELVERMEAGTGLAGPSPDTVVADSTNVVAIGAGRRRNRWVSWGVGAVAAAAVVVAVVLGAQVNHLNHQVRSLQSPSLSAAEQAALSSPSTRTVQLTALSGSHAPAPGRVTVILTRSGTGFVEAQGLSALPADQTYQLWGMVGGNVISLGLMGSDPTVVPFSVAGNRGVSAFAITAERADGVVQSTNQPVVAGAVHA